MTDVEHLLTRAARAAAEHRRTVGDVSVAPSRSPEQIRAAFAGPLPDVPSDPEAVLNRLLVAADGAITGTVRPRLFGFVIGGALPAASAAEILTTGWDQVAYNDVLSPAAGAAERAAGGWAKELLGLPTESSVAFVTGAQADVPLPQVAAMVARCDALISSDVGAAVGHFERALALHDHCTGRLDSARTRLMLGMRLRRAGRRVDARSHSRPHAASSRRWT